MTDKELVKQMEALGRSLGARIVYGRPRGPGGTCTWRSSDFVVIRSDSDPAQRVDLLARYLAQKDLDGLSLPDEVRAAIEAARNEPAEGAMSRGG